MAAAEHLRSVIESCEALLVGHIRLFKVELAEDAKVIGVQIGKIAAFAPLILVGYGFLCAALALFLQRYLSADLAFLLVGVLNVAVGAGGAYLAAMKLKERQVLEQTRAEVVQTGTALSNAVLEPTVTVEVTRG